MTTSRWGVRRQRRALLWLSLCLLACASCRTANESAPNEAPATGTTVSTTPPFQTKEPDRYRATRTITISTPNGETIVTKTAIAKDGPLRREEPQDASPRVVYLEVIEGRFVLLPDARVYAAATPDDAEPDTEDNSPDRLLHLEPINTTYQSLGTETIAGRSAQKYRIVVNSSASENVTPNETLMWIDETLNMPIRSETKSADGARTTMELSDIMFNPDNALFQIPTGYEKIAFGELHKQLKASRLNP
jgi:outer membrane lipoprotein-sorting protein